ncbi:MAG: glycosyltransferase family 2 protein [Azoarcus sp.]|nr:glycosyltransferase family 2 protein [Azoarcus sp.]
MRNIGFVVTTLGRVQALNKLLTSLIGQLILGDQIVVVTQRNVDQVQDLVGNFNLLPITVTTSDRGAALGRNVGVQTLPEGDFVLQFPNDTTWFPDGVVSHMRSAVAPAKFRFGSMTVIDEQGSKFVIPSPDSLLNKFTVWKVIEMGLLVCRSDFARLGGFDPSIGTGASTPWQSGEAADLLLRALAESPSLAHEFLWLPNSIALGGVTETHGLNKTERRQKLLAYGRGLGWVARQYNYPFWWKLKTLIGGATKGIRHPEYKILDGGWGFMGRLEGMLGRTFRKGEYYAVFR